MGAAHRGLSDRDEHTQSEQMRVQGVIFGLGACMLLLAHMQSGVVTWETLPLLGGARCARSDRGVDRLSIARPD